MRGVLAERVRRAIEEKNFQNGDARLPVTVSAGVAAYGEDTDESISLVEAADTALYAAKQAGRNQVLLKYGDSHRGT